MPFYIYADYQLCSNCTNSHHVYYTDDTAVKYINGNITLTNDLNLDIYNVMFYHLKHGRFKPLSIPIELNCKHHRLFIIIILCSGDISLNPGPIKYPCGKCYKPVAKNHRAIFCEVGNQWWHIKCANVTPQEYKDLEQNSDPWICNLCNNFNFSESFFDTSLDFSHSLHENSKVDEDIFDELRQLKRKHPKKFICVYLNINSLRYKFCHICELLTSNTIDMLFLAETKIDDQFPDAQFQVNNYHFWRADRTAYGGGIAAYVRSDLPCDRKKILEFKNIESICIEILVGNKKWLISGVYRPQTINDKTFNDDFIKTCDKITTKYDNFMYIGDLNYDFLDEKKCAPLVSVCDILDLTNLVKRPTCFTKIADPTLNDVILTNSPNNCMNVLNFNCGISDVHNLISVQIKGNINPAKKSFKTYRSFKNFSEENFVNDLMKSDLDKITEIEDVDEAYNKFEEVMVNTIDEHAPMKKRKSISQPAPFMNKTLRSAVYKKRMTHNKFLKDKSNKNWEAYRKQRNLVTKLKKQSIRTYFY